MQELAPILVADLFPQLEAKLIELLRSLSPDDWNRPTITPFWRVKDVAAHLLDSNLRRLSMARDGFLGEKPKNVTTYEDLVAFLNGLNAVWVKACKRLSPRVLTDLLEQTSQAACEYYQQLDPSAEALFSVAWAGEERSLNWFDLAREYTERWHHQQQIRLAVNKPGIMGRELYYPALDAFMRALPFRYKDVEAKEGAIIRFHITGGSGGTWFLLRLDGGWKLIREPIEPLESEVDFSQDIAWRIFTKGVAQETALAQIIVRGDRRLGEHIVNVIAVMA